MLGAPVHAQGGPGVRFHACMAKVERVPIGRLQGSSGFTRGVPARGTTKWTLAHLTRRRVVRSSSASDVEVAFGAPRADSGG